MQGDRAVMVSHKVAVKGMVVHSFPLTDDIKSAFEINSRLNGWIVGVKFENPEILEAFRSGALTGFSIGGFIQRET